ncbi:hypothetical protein VNO77_44036 [Canavalia gladiata]|uniref:Uncharacterized protein n=1 Tax=Canavalia gladiata TaxID=3824 RepID=A0AAN9JXB8_CANGL
MPWHLQELTSVSVEASIAQKKNSHASLEDLDCITRSRSRKEGYYSSIDIIQFANQVHWTNFHAYRDEVSLSRGIRWKILRELELLMLEQSLNYLFKVLRAESGNLKERNPPSGISSLKTRLSSKLGGEPVATSPSICIDKIVWDSMQDHAELHLQGLKPWIHLLFDLSIDIALVVLKENLVRDEYTLLHEGY